MLWSSLPKQSLRADLPGTGARGRFGSNRGTQSRRRGKSPRWGESKPWHLVSGSEPDPALQSGKKGLDPSHLVAFDCSVLNEAIRWKIPRAFPTLNLQPSPCKDTALSEKQWEEGLKGWRCWGWAPHAKKRCRQGVQTGLARTYQGSIPRVPRAASSSWHGVPQSWLRTALAATGRALQGRPLANPAAARAISPPLPRSPSRHLARISPSLGWADTSIQLCGLAVCPR